MARIVAHAKGRAVWTEQDDGLDKNDPRHTRDLLTWVTGLMSSTAAKTYKGEKRVLKRLALSPDGRWIVIAEGKGWMMLFDTEQNAATGKVLKSLQGHGSSIDGLTFNSSRWCALGLCFSASAFGSPGTAFLRTLVHDQTRRDILHRQGEGSTGGEGEL